MSDKEIIEKFYYEYYRVPMYKEFVILGGKVSKKSYYNLVKKLNYPSNPRRFTCTLEVLENGEVIFTGNSREVAEELGVTLKWIEICVRNHRKVKGFNIRKKKFNIERVKEHE